MSREATVRTLVSLSVVAIGMLLLLLGYHASGLEISDSGFIMHLSGIVLLSGLSGRMVGVYRRPPSPPRTLRCLKTPKARSYPVPVIP